MDRYAKDVYKSTYLVYTFILKSSKLTHTGTSFKLHKLIFYYRLLLVSFKTIRIFSETQIYISIFMNLFLRNSYNKALFCVSFFGNFAIHSLINARNTRLLCISRCKTFKKNLGVSFNTHTGIPN